MALFFALVGIMDASLFYPHGRNRLPFWPATLVIVAGHAFLVGTLASVVLRVRRKKILGGAIWRPKDSMLRGSTTSSASARKSGIFTECKSSSTNCEVTLDAEMKGRVTVEAKIESLEDLMLLRNGLIPADQARSVAAADALVSTGGNNAFDAGESNQGLRA